MADVEKGKVNDTEGRIPVTLTWKDVSYTVTLKAKRKCCKVLEPAREKKILQHMTGVVRPGEFLAIMGPSGAGKSSLINILAGKYKKGVAGDIRVNNQPVTRSLLNRCAAIVAQDDLLLSTLTPYEILVFAARLRLPKEWSVERKMGKVEEVIAELGLEKCRDTRIGLVGGTVGISGGERKRVSIAVELLTNPSLLVVDEPTSGLDSTTAESVVRTLMRLSQSGRTVICTIHQPSSQIYALFDKLLLLSRGRTAYFGNAGDGAVQHFAKQGYHCPAKFNPSDYFLHLLADKRFLSAEEMEDIGGDDRFKKNGDVEMGHVNSAPAAAPAPAPAALAPPAPEASATKEKTSTKSKSGSSSSSSSSSDTEEAKTAEPAPAAAQPPAPAATPATGFVAAPPQPAAPPSKPPTPNSGAPPTDALDAIIAYYASSNLAHQIEESLVTESAKAAAYPINVGGSSFTTSMIVQLGLLLKRAFMVETRTPILFQARAFQTIFLGLICGLIFQGVSLEQTGYQDRTGALYFLSIQMIMPAVFGNLQTLPLELPLFRREHGNGMYATTSYYIAKVAADLPAQIIFPAIFGSISYFIIGLQSTAAKFFTTIGVMIFMSNVGVSYGFLISSAAPNAQVALVGGPLVMIVLLLFGGLFRNVGTLPSWIGWLQYISPLRWGYELLIRNEFTGLVFDCPAGVRCAVQTGEQAINLLGMDKYPFWEPLVLLLAILVGAHGLALIIMNAKTRAARK